MKWRRAFAQIVCGAAVLTFVLTGASPVYAYNGNGAASWADSHWNGNPPTWPTFSNDCANFVSLALWIGGGYAQVPGNYSTTDDHNWFMYSTPQGYHYSHSWTVNNDHYTFQILHYPGGYAYGTVSGTYGGNDSLSNGDELFYDWTNNGLTDHNSIQVGYGTDPNSGWYGDLIDQHTTNRYHAYWTLQPYNAQASTTVIYEMHISSSN